MARTPKGSYHPKRKLWYVTLWGKQRVLAKGPKKETEAEARAELRRLIQVGKPVEASQEKSRPTLSTLAGFYLTHVQRENDPATYANYNKYISDFVTTTGRTVPSDTIRPHHVDAWLARRTLGPTTRAFRISIIKGLYRWSKRRGYLAADPLAEMEKPTSLIRDLVLTPAQADDVADAATDQEFHDLLLALRETGARPGEIYTLTCERVDFKSGTWTVKNKTRRKTGEPWRTVYLSQPMVELSRRLVLGQEGLVFRNSWRAKWTDGCVRMRLARIRERLGFGPEITAYAYRHLYCTEALMRSVPPATVAELMGHTSLKMVMRVYSKLKTQTEHLREAAKQARST